jgi:hypothetical protein
MNSAMITATFDSFILVLDPSGDAHHTGRAVQDSYERGISLQYAQALKEHLESSYPHLQAHITRRAGSTAEPYVFATLGNNLQAHLYIHLTFYFDREQATITWYTLHYGDEPTHYKPTLTWCPCDKAHHSCYSKSLEYAHTMYHYFENNHNRAPFKARGVYSLPYKPLLGIQIPAFGIEIGLKKSTMWKDFVGTIASSLEPIITNTMALL